jgi:hypothetical protein
MLAKQMKLILWRLWRYALDWSLPESFMIRPGRARSARPADCAAAEVAVRKTDRQSFDSMEPWCTE